MKNINFSMSLVYILLISVFLGEMSCSSYPRQKEKLLDITEELKTNVNREILHIHIFQDTSNNLFINVYGKHDYLYASGGIGHSDISQEPQLVNACQLDETESLEYVIHTYDKGSTYGAKKMFVIWHDGNVWNLTRDIFERAFLKDINNDGIFEFVELYNNSEGVPYQFKEGNFYLLK